MDTKRKISLLLRQSSLLCTALATVGALAAGSSQAASEAEKRAAIDAGLGWLAGVQQVDGRWLYDGTVGDTAATGAALLAFLEEKNNWGANAVAFQTVVDKGLDYLFSKATPYTIFPQPYGNPDVNGNGIGIKFVPGGNNSRDTYVTGLVVPAIVATGTPNAIVGTGSQAGRTYGDVVQDVVDYFAYGQNEFGYARGSWRYYANSGDADGSTAQWPPVAMLYAQSFGATTPEFVKSELENWIDYIQHPSGGSGYASPGDILNESKTGGLLAMMEFSGYDGYKPGDTLGETEALNYINATWRNFANSTWNGNFAHPYSMWSIYKGLELTIGLDDESTITNLLSSDCGGNVDNPDHGCNWFEDYAEWLVSNQNLDGSWTGYSYWNNVLATPWHVNILAATRIPVPPIPEPSSLALLFGGLAALALAPVTMRSRRRRGW